MSGGGKKHRRWRLSGHKKVLEGVRTDINVTPLVDVMLVLLIIFMLMTLLMGRGQDVNLPTASNFSSEKDKSQPVVSIDLNGDLFVEKNRIGPVGPQTLKEMNEQVQAAWKAPKNPEGVGRIYLKADSKLDYAKVYPVVEYMNKEMAMQQIDLAITKASKE
ncbi:MAG: biopolymer transporter ExbD [Proteobacteria bacterium]|nr:biopolymer transporter ExbD [Pseudomonadota bacterium]